MKRKLINLTPAICYALQSVAGLVLAIIMYSVGVENKEQPSGSLLLVLLSVLLVAIGATYFVVGIVPLLLRVISLFKEKRVFVIVCMVFDVIYMAISALMLACSFVAGFPFAGVLFVFLALLSGVSLGMNILAADKEF